METYAELAETVADPDELCSCLLETVATALGTQLSPAEQSDVVAGTAARLGPKAGSPEPLAATLLSLETRGLIGSYTLSPWSATLDDGTRSVVVGLSDYALAPRHGRLPVFPFAVALSRRTPRGPPSSLSAEELGDGWRVTVVLSDGIGPDGLATAPITSEV
jgi:hypothetical protein